MDAPGNAALPDSVHDACRLAAQRGRDASGRFWSAADWLALDPTGPGVLAAHLRADGPGWSIVAHTEDIAFVLLDEEPGEVLPVGRGSELPSLLAALDSLAVREDDGRGYPPSEEATVRAATSTGSQTGENGGA